MDTKELRQKILDLAIRGKLVPQDPNDEPASVLLERIRAEKERLIAEGKIKRPKKSKASSAESHYQNFTPPFSIPDSWEWVRLEEIISVKSGENIIIRELRSLDSYPIYGGNGINGYYSKSNVKEGTLIIGRVGYYCGIVHKTKSDAWVTDNALIVTYDKQNISTDWLYLVLNWSDIRKTSNSTAQPVVSGKSIYPLAIPIPPLKEQERIVQSYQSYDIIMSSLEIDITGIANIIAQTKSKILDLAMQGKLVPQDPADEPAADMLLRINPKARIITDNPHSWNIPKGWCWVKVSDVFSPMKRKLPEGDIFCYIDIDSIDNKKNIAYPKNISTSSAPSRASRFTQKGDVVFSMVRPYLRNIALVPENDCIASTGFYVFHPLEVINSKFSYILTLSSYFVDGLNSYMKGDNSPSINKDNVESFVIPLPPRNEQQRIVAKIEKLYSALNEIEASLQS